ncbi:putative cytochrome p450 [Lyophyllum shimeji]|uniref:Cytochrome p450 n=1 Tax=Lyophyllum shimeji TaxID=47721 RepID=A0A9P3PRA6_LYOSH|nr:putative cytochrome p450 [Lyophyllum shimeji]
MDLFSQLASLSYRDAVLSVIGAGLLTHFIFKRTETHEPLHLVALLLGFPAALTFLLLRYFSSFLGAIAATFFIFWATLATSILTYRLSPWHPLARYPGPFLCRVSKLYFAFLSLRGKQHTYYARLHEQYGDVVRVGPNELSFRDADAIAPMMGPQGLAKGPFWDGRIPEAETTKPLIALRDKTEHTRRRRPWTRAFSTGALKGYEVMITSRCTQLVETLGNQAGSVDMTKWISYFAYDVMNDLAFGGGTEMISEGDVDGLWHLLEAGQKNAIFMSHVPWLGALFLRFPNFATDLKAFRQHAKKCAMARKKRGSPHMDLFHHLIDEDGISSTPPTVFEVVSDGGLAIIAGSDTTSSAITNLFYYLLCNPKAYKRMQAEMDDLGESVTDYATQAHMPYLNASLNESLRLLPPVLSGSQRYVDVGKAIGSHYVPKGTSTFVHFYSLHRDPRYFSPLPDAFLPERWLPPDMQIKLEPGHFKDQANVVLNANAFIPFSFGPSNCVGKNLAWMEMRMLVCMMMQKYEMRFEEGYRPEWWEENTLDYFVMMKGRLPVVLTPRR